MKSNLLIAVVVLLSLNNAQAQLPNGSTAPDFTLVDLNGVTHNLYTYLDSGYTVFLDFSAVWCSPCWSYHASHALKNVYENHGPSGFPDVSSATTNDVMVFFIEGDGSSVAQLNGGSGSQGDWVTGTTYPIICTDPAAVNSAGIPVGNSASITSNYAIGYWPTVYQVCSNRLLTECGQEASPYSLVTSCLPPPAHQSDARSYMDEGPALTCGDITPKFMLQNYGLSNLTEVTITVSLNGTIDTTILYNTTSTWDNSIGAFPPLNLSTLEVDEVILPTLTGLSQNDLIEIDVTLPNTMVDQDGSNNQTISFNVNLGYGNAYWDAPLSIDVALDDPAVFNSTAWFLSNSADADVGSGYGDVIGTNNIFPLVPEECYTLRILGGANVAYEITDGRPTGGVVIASGTATSEDFTTNFTTGAQIWTGVKEVSEKFNIYPNPVNNVLTIDGNYTSATIYNVVGKAVLNTDYQKTIDVTTLGSGIYFIRINTEKAITVKKITIVK